MEKKICAWRWRYDGNCWKNIIIKWNRTRVKRKSWSVDTRQYIIILSLYHFIVVNAKARKRVHEQAKWQTWASIRFLFHWREHPCIANEICATSLANWTCGKHSTWLVSPMGPAIWCPCKLVSSVSMTVSACIAIVTDGSCFTAKANSGFHANKRPLCKLFENRPIYVKSL